MDRTAWTGQTTASINILYNFETQRTDRGSTDTGFFPVSVEVIVERDSRQPPGDHHTGKLVKLGRMRGCLSKRSPRVTVRTSIYPCPLSRSERLLRNELGQGAYSCTQQQAARARAKCKSSKSTTL